MPRQSITAFLDDFTRHGRQTAYVQRRGYRSERWSYHDIAVCAYQTARELEARKISKGDRILLWSPNSAEWIAAFFAGALTGAISVPIDDSATPAFAQRVCAQVNASLAFCSREHASHLPGIPVVILEDLRTQVSRHSAASISTPSTQSPSDPLEIIFTSGTTADPKGVVLTHANVLANIAPLETEIQKYLKYERWVHPVRFLNLLPLSHVFGQFLGIFLPPLLAATVVFQQALGPSEVIASVRRERVSVLVAVPRMLQSLKEKILRDQEEAAARFRAALDSVAHVHFLRRWWIFRRIHRQFGWKFWAMISGGAALDRETEEFWGRLGYAVIQGYGLTETTSLISLNHPFHLGKGSIGKVLPGREVKLADDGEILVRGGGVASGYWTNAGASNEVASTEVAGTDVSDKDGWYRTGDIGARDEAGNLYFKGRKKEVLVTPAGMNIYPEDLEAALRQQPEVRDCVIIAREIGGNAEPCAVLLLRDATTDPEPVLRRANATLADYQRMRAWFVWPDADFPRTATQKPKTSIIREAALAHLEARPANSAPAQTANPLAELITRVSGRELSTLSPQANLEDDLHLSSLERVEVMSALEERYQLDLSETAFSSARTVAELQQVLTKNAGERLTYDYPRWALHWPATWLRLLAHYALMRPALVLLGWPRIEGREYLRNLHEPVLVVCNHIADVDPGFVLTALPARYRHRLAIATGGETLQSYRTPSEGTPLLKRLYLQFKWILAAALLNLFPLPRAAGFQKSFAHAGECIDQGYSVLVFPEGQLTKDGQLQPFRAGVGLLASQVNVPVLPMRIDGLFEVKESGRKFAAPWKIRVRIGKPIRFESGKDPQDIAHELQQIVADLA